MRRRRRGEQGELQLDPDDDRLRAIIISDDTELPALLRREIERRFDSAQCSTLPYPADVSTLLNGEQIVFIDGCSDGPRAVGLVAAMRDAQDLRPAVVIISADGDGEAALKCGAFDYLRRDDLQSDSLARVLRHARASFLTTQHLEYHARFEQLLTSVATDFINLAPETIDEGISRALQQIGWYAGADRSFVFQLAPDGESITMTHEWHAEGIDAAALYYREISSMIFAPILALATDGGPALRFDRIADLPREAVQLRELMQFRKVKSVIFVPLRLLGRTIGILGFSSLRREKHWTAEVTALLEFVGQIIVNALERKQSDIKFQKQKEYLRQVIDMSPNLLFVRDLSGRYELINTAYAKLLGRPISEIIGRTDGDLGVPPAELQNRERDDRDVSTKGTPKFVPEEPLTDLSTHETRWYRTTKYPLRGAESGEAQVLTISTDLTERKRAEVALRTILEGTASATAENFFRSLVRHLALVLDTKYAFVGKLVPSNGAVVETLAVFRDGDYIPNERYSLADSPTEDVLKGSLRLYPDNVQAVFPKDHFLQQEGIVSYMGAPLLNSDGKPLGILSVMDDKPMRDWPPGKWILRIFAARAAAELERLVVEDERHALQKQLLQAQKMEAIGQLAAGIAHDLNNALGAVVGHLQLLHIAARLEPEWKKSVNVALLGCERAGSLVEQLLGFSRQGRYNLSNLSPRQVVVETLDFLSRVIEKDVQIELSERESGLSIMADQAQVQQALTNIILNAAQAMPHGGKMTIEFKSALVRNPQQFNRKAAPGRYAQIAVADTGVGIAEENLEKIFEPFFSTKEHGKGSGLGLSMVYGIMQNHGGWVEATSQPNRGSTFTLYFPLAEKIRTASESETTRTITKASGTVMVIDDEAMLVDLTAKFLERAGFTPIGFTSATEALRWYRDHSSEVDMVILDMKMPDMTGETCFHRLREINPDAKVVILSGYIQDVHVHRVLDQGAVRFFQKPLKYPELMSWISEFLKGGAGRKERARSS